MLPQNLNIQNHCSEFKSSVGERIQGYVLLVSRDHVITFLR